MASTPHLKVYNPTHGYVAACKFGEDAACLAAMNGNGTTIRDGHNHIVWTEGAEAFSAGESYDRVAQIIDQRIQEKWAKARALHAAREAEAAARAS